MLIPFGVFSAAGAGGGGAAGDYELISTTILGSSQTSVTFNVSTYASTYKHLQLRMVTRQSHGSVATVTYRVQFNGDTTTSNYRDHSTLGSGSSVTAVSGANNSQIGIITTTADGDSNRFAPTITDILDPFSSSKNTTWRSLTGTSGTAPDIRLLSGFWNNTATVTSILINAYGDNLLTGSRFSLYGIKG